MDRFTRNYTAGLIIVVVIFAAVWMRSTAQQPRVAEINAMLEADPLVANYPYRFRAVAFDNGVATLMTPRSFDVPASRFLVIIYPQLAGKTEMDPAMIAAQKALVDAQKRAMDLVEALPDVESVHWSLDARWLADHGVVGPVNFNY